MAGHPELGLYNSYVPIDVLVPTCCLSVSTCSCRVSVSPFRWFTFCWLSISRFWLASSSSVNWSRASCEFSHWVTLSWYHCAVSASSSRTERVVDWDSLSCIGQRYTVCKCCLNVKCKCCLNANGNKKPHTYKLYLLLRVLEFLLQMFHPSLHLTHLFYCCHVLLLKNHCCFFVLLGLWTCIL